MLSACIIRNTTRLIRQRQEYMRHYGDSPFKKGWCARFVRVSDNWGFKFFTSAWQRDFSLQLQGFIHRETGFCPAVGWSIDTMASNEETDTVRDVYGFYTEVAKLSGPAPDNWLAEVERELRKLGVHASDLCDFNVGKMPDGRWVCIDVGNFGWSRQ